MLRDKHTLHRQNIMHLSAIMIVQAKREKNDFVVTIARQIESYVFGTVQPNHIQKFAELLVYDGDKTQNGGWGDKNENLNRESVQLKSTRKQMQEAYYRHKRYNFLLKTHLSLYNKPFRKVCTKKPNME